jgi:hypothetical protein
LLFIFLEFAKTKKKELEPCAARFVIIYLPVPTHAAATASASCLSNLTVDYGVWVTNAKVGSACTTIYAVIIHYTVNAVYDVITSAARHDVTISTATHSVITSAAIHAPCVSNVLYILNCHEM